MTLTSVSSPDHLQTCHSCLQDTYDMTFIYIIKYYCPNVIDIVVPSSDHCGCIETVPPSSDHYGSTKVATLLTKHSPKVGGGGGRMAPVAPAGYATGSPLLVSELKRSCTFPKIANMYFLLCNNNNIIH